MWWWWQLIQEGMVGHLHVSPFSLWSLGERGEERKPDGWAEGRRRGEQSKASRKKQVETHATAEEATSALMEGPSFPRVSHKPPRKLPTFFLSCKSFHVSNMTTSMQQGWR